MQVNRVQICTESVLELVCDFMANECRSKYGILFVSWTINIENLLEHGEITLLGLSLVGFNFLTLLYYDASYLTEKDGANGPPQWIYFTHEFPCR